MEKSQERVTRFDWPKFMACLKTKRGSKSLRDIASEIDGVSFTTLYRIEQGTQTGLQTILHMCDWMQISLSEFLLEDSQKQACNLSVYDRIEVLLRNETQIPEDVIPLFMTLARRLDESMHEMP